jgi:hypothetical protein
MKPDSLEHMSMSVNSYPMPPTPGSALDSMGSPCDSPPIPQPVFEPLIPKIGATTPAPQNELPLRDEAFAAIKPVTTPAPR